MSRGLQYIFRGLDIFLVSIFPPWRGHRLEDGQRALEELLRTRVVAQAHVHRADVPQRARDLRGSAAN